MSTPTPGNPQPNPPGKKELSMENRMLIAFGLMALILLATPYIVPSPKKDKAGKRPPAKAAETDAPAKTSAPEVAPPVPVPTGQVVGQKEETVALESDLYRVQFSSRGGAVRSWVLKKYKDSQGRPLELVNLKAAGKAGYPFEVLGKDRKPLDAVNGALFAWRQTSPLAVEFEFSDGKLHCRKSFELRSDSYLTQVSSLLTEVGRPVQHYLAWRGGFGDSTVLGAAAAQHSVYYDVGAAKLQVKSAGDAGDGGVAERGNYSFAGIEDQYFAAVILPRGDAPFEIATLADTVADALEEKEQPHVGVGLGGEAELRATLFVGPKDMDVLRRVAPKLEQLVDFGWFAFFAKPLFLALHWFNDKYINNYGWSIVIVTVIINFLLLPLKITSLKSMKKMQVLQPQIAAINEKYKGMSLRDPRKAQQNQEVMELYKKHGVNPLGGCMPMVLQIPFLFAFYKVLTVAIELRGAAWLWVSDLSRPEDLGIRILPIAMVASQFVLQKMTPSTGMDPAQQKVMLFMPLMFGFMFYGVSSGLVLYLLTGNLVAIGQQLFFNRMYQAQPVAPAKAPAKKRESR